MVKQPKTTNNSKTFSLMKKACAILSTNMKATLQWQPRRESFVNHLILLEAVSHKLLIYFNAH